jgi:archaellum biogenesis protein FlaJ (TadC family)
MDNYLIYLLVWIGVLFLLGVLFKLIPKKMKETKNIQTKNTMFTILMLIGIPLTLIAVIGPIVLVAVDEDMPLKYRYGFGIIALLIVGYMLFLQMAKKKES